MSEPLSAPTALIIDEDVGFVWWLGEIFREVGYLSIPALGAGDALALVDQTSLAITLLVLNPKLDGIQDVINKVTMEGLRSHTPAPKVVQILDLDFESTGIRALAALKRPTKFEAISKTEWVQKIRGLLTQIGARAAS